jgi:microcystin-dependent protein
MVKVTSSNIILSTTLTQNKKMGITGSIGMWVGSSPPDGALLCNGQLCNTLEYPDLAASLGASGPTFLVPNLQGELPLGTNSNVRAEGGNLKIQNINHVHTVNQSRFIDFIGSNNIRPGTMTPQLFAFLGSQNPTTSVITTPNTTDSQIDYLPPYFAVNFIIYT